MYRQQSSASRSLPIPVMEMRQSSAARSLPPIPVMKCSNPLAEQHACLYWRLDISLEQNLMQTPRITLQMIYMYHILPKSIWLARIKVVLNTIVFEYHSVATLSYLLLLRAGHYYQKTPWTRPGTPASRHKITSSSLLPENRPDDVKLRTAPGNRAYCRACPARSHQSHQIPLLRRASANQQRQTTRILSDANARHSTLE